MANLVFLCGNCGEPIRNPKDGILIRGNIYVADPHDRGGLVGDAFPDVENGKIIVSKIKEYAFCKKCFIEMIPWEREDWSAAIKNTHGKQYEKISTISTKMR